MDSTLIQLINHIFDLESEKKILTDFLLRNEAVLRAANAEVPGLDEPGPSQGQPRPQPTS